MSGPAPLHPVAPRLKNGPKPHVGPTINEYRALHAKTIGLNSDEWWTQTARETLHWYTPFHTVRSGGFVEGDVAWFPEGTLNASYNCVDRWAFKHPNKTAIIYEADEPNQSAEITYAQLLNEVSSVANVLKSLAVSALLACARIGAVHSVVFAGFSAEALRDRINDCKSRVVLTADEGRRGGKTIATKSIVDAALKGCPHVEHVLVLKRTGNQVPWTEGRDKWWHDETARDPLFILYGLVHTTGGYLLGAALTLKNVFDVHPDDRFACVADVGWITGHTYIVYGPLANGVSTTVFESTPVYPTPSRYWQMHVAPHDLSSLRVIGSVGEPINPEAWNWYNDHVGRHQCAVVDTYWQTETGSIVVTPLPGAIETKAGSATVPFFGIDPVIVDPQTGKVVTFVTLSRNPWPSIARTVFQDHKRYLATYMASYPGFYFTGDGAARDEHGYIWIKGRVDDVINVSGHRLSTAEIESALIQHHGVAETAVIAAEDELTGQAVYAFVTLKPYVQIRPNDEAGLSKELVLQVRKSIGPFAAPKRIYIVPDLPKTRSGKIMRRIMRKIASGEGEQLGISAHSPSRPSWTKSRPKLPPRTRSCRSD
ncbi:acetate--CoA ligase [Lactifluus volemus]|nr:acetate--CoA ligase [Lactifluus volemus]